MNRRLIPWYRKMRYLRADGFDFTEGKNRLMPAESLIKRTIAFIDDLRSQFVTLESGYGKHDLRFHFGISNHGG
jgi:hypothetical protein